MLSPRITVITPSYNQGKYLERTICSVLDQGYANLEYFVIDGGSWDESGDIVRHYADALSWACIAPDFGAADGINKGLRRATGQIIAIVNADDLLLPRALDKVAQHMSDTPDARWAAGHVLRIDEADRMLGELRASTPSSPANFVMHNSGYLPSSATFWRREVFQSHGYFDAHLHRAYAYEHACRLLVEGVQPHILPCTLAARREHAANRSAMQAVEYNLEMIEASQRLGARLPVTQQYALHANCDVRRRIVALAQAEQLAQTRRAA